MADRHDKAGVSSTREKNQLMAEMDAARVWGINGEQRQAQQHALSDKPAIVTKSSVV